MIRQRNPKAKQHIPNPDPNTQTDILDLAQVQQVVQQGTPYQYRRVVRYRGIQGEIHTVSGAQVVAVTPYGATIYPDGPNSMQQRVIPWTRIWEVDSDPTDPMMQWNK